MPKYVNQPLSLPLLPLDEATRSIFSFYNPTRFAGITDEELAKHIAAVRDEATHVSDWECLHLFMFVPPRIRLCAPDGHYQRVLDTLRQDRCAKYLEVGAMFCMGARALIQDGVMAQQIVCTDLLPEFFEYGHKLFGDKATSETLKGLVTRKLDIFNEQDIEAVLQLAPQGFQVIYADLFIHLFPLQDQKRAVKALDHLLANSKGATLIGSTAGTESGQDLTVQMAKTYHWGKTGLKSTEENEAPAYLHSPPSLDELFRQSMAADSIDVYIDKRQKLSTHKTLEFTFGQDLPPPRQLHFAVVRK